MIGLVALLFWYLINFRFPFWFARIITILVMIVLSGAIHIDGLLDTSDGIFSGKPREVKLQIMKDSRIGSMAFIAGIFYFAFYLGLLIELPEWILLRALILIPTAGRWSMAISVYLLPYGRNHGLGLLFNPGKGTVGKVLLLSIYPTLLSLVLLGFKGVFILLPVVITYFIAVRLAKVLGGLTGDTYGFINQGAELLTLITIFLM
jgi:adenosylcobinamide-GDP ribazoletransferase